MSGAGGLPAAAGSSPIERKVSTTSARVVAPRAASGIGLGIAERFLAADARAAIADLRLDAAQAAADELTARDPEVAIGVSMHVADEAQVQARVETVVET